MLDAVAARYGSDPWTVSKWPFERFFLAAAAVAMRDVRVAKMVSSMQAKAKAPPIFIVANVADVASMVAPE